MALAASGTMSIGGSISGRSINLELGRSATATSSLGETDLRNLAGVSSGAISIGNFYNASSGVDYYTGSEWSPSGISNPDAAFDATLTGSGSNGGNFGPFTYTFVNPISQITSLILRGSLGATPSQVGGTINVIKVNGQDVTQLFKNAGAWAGNAPLVTCTGALVNSTLTTFTVQGVSGSTNPNISGVYVNGTQLITI